MPHVESTSGFSLSGPRIEEPAAGDHQFSITDLAAAFGITPRAIRFYEDQGLLQPQRRGQTRSYSRADKARLAWVLRGKRVGFSLADIKEMLDLYGAGDGRATQRRVTLDRCRDRLHALQEQQRDIAQMIAELSDFCATLEALVKDEPSRAS